MSAECPKCGANLESNHSSCPACGSSIDPMLFEGDLGELENAILAETGLTLGQRLAGLALLLNGILVTVENGLMGMDADLPASPVGALLDVGLGIALLANRRSVLGFVKFRVIAGVLVYCGLHLAAGDAIMTGMQLIFSASLLALLFGNAGRFRLATACAAVIALMGFEIVGLHMLSTGRTPAAGMLDTTYDLQDIESPEYVSADHPYRISVPTADWSRRSKASAQADNPLSDLWIVNPEVDGHIMVVAENVPPGYEVAMDAFATQVEDNARTAATEFAVEDRGHVAAIHTLGNQIDATGAMQGMNMRFRYGLFTKERHGVQVVCFAREESFSAIQAACDATLESFEFIDERVLASR